MEPAILKAISEVDLVAKAPSMRVALMSTIG